MRLEIDCRKGDARISDARNLRALDAITIGRCATQAEFPDFIHPDSNGDHLWVAINALKALGHPDDYAWTRGFDDMIAFARSKGWVDASGATVRLHIVASLAADAGGPRQAATVRGTLATAHGAHLIEAHRRWQKRP